MQNNNRYARILANYERHCRRVAQASSIDLNEKPAEKIKRMQKLEKDYITWFEYYLPVYAKVKSASFHRQMADKVIRSKKIKALFEAYRSSGKSVHIDLGIPLYLYLAKNDMKYMLLIGETEPKGTKLLSAIQAELQYNNRIKNDYGEKFRQGDWSEGNFLTSDGVRFSSLGFLQNPRGVREAAERPDYIVVDDVDNKRHVNNDRMMREAVDFITEEVWGCFDAGDNATERFVFANNNFHKNSITNRLKTFFAMKIREAKEKGEEHEFFLLRVDSVKNTNTFEPTWPEKTSAEYWRKKFDAMPYRSFMREYMNTHVSEGKVFKAEWIQYAKPLPWKQYEAIVAYGDLSWSDEACHKSIVFLGKHRRQLHILKVFFRQSSRMQLAAWLYDTFEEEGLNRLPHIRYIIEGLFAMSEFINDFDTEGDARGYYIPVVASKRSKGDKFDRIEGMSGFFERRNVFWNEREKDSADMVLATDTLLAFEKGAKIPLDFLDALQGAITELNAMTFVSSFDIKTTPLSAFQKNRY